MTWPQGAADRGRPLAVRQGVCKAADCPSPRFRAYAPTLTLREL